jgi:hypothetical protein
MRFAHYDIHSEEISYYKRHTVAYKMTEWKSNDTLQLEKLQYIGELVFEMKNHQNKLSGDQALVMSKMVLILQEMSETNARILSELASIRSSHS